MCSLPYSTYRGANSPPGSLVYIYKVKIVQKLRGNGLSVREGRGTCGRVAKIVVPENCPFPCRSRPRFFLARKRDFRAGWARGVSSMESRERLTGRRFGRTRSFRRPIFSPSFFLICNGRPLNEIVFSVLDLFQREI